LNVPKRPKTKGLAAQPADPAQPATFEGELSTRPEESIVADASSPIQSEEEVQPSSSPRERWLIDLVTRAMVGLFYKRRARGKHRLTGGAFDLLEYAFLAAAREAARRVHGVIIVAGQGALVRAARRLSIEVKPATLTTYTGFWNEVFAGAEIDGILSEPVKTDRGMFRVRFFMRGDKPQHQFYITVEDAHGKPVIHTDRTGLRVPLGESADRLLIQQIQESHDALTEIKAFIRGYRREIATCLAVVLIVLSLSRDVRAAAVRWTRAAVRFIETQVSKVTGAPPPPPDQTEAVPPAKPLVVESAPPPPPEFPQPAQEGGPITFPPNFLRDTFLTSPTSTGVTHTEMGRKLDPEAVARAFIEVTERDPETGLRREIDHDLARRIYPEIENISMSVTRDDAASEESTLSLSARVTGPEWAMRPPRFIKWGFFRVLPSGGLEPYTPATGKQVFQRFRKSELYAVVLAIESPIYGDGKVWLEHGLALLKYERDQWKLEYPAKEVALDSVDMRPPFRLQVIPGRRWNEPYKGAYYFFIFPGVPALTKDPSDRDRELLIDFGDGSTTDRDYACGPMELPKGDPNVDPLYAVMCTTTHRFTTPGPKTITIRIVDKSKGTHPNHPVVDSVSTTIDVTDVP
jgi:hypothetical protein